MVYLLGILGVICLIHYLVIVGYAGTRAAFASFWLISGCLCFLFSMMWGIFTEVGIISRIPFSVIVLFWIIVSICLIAFFILLSFVVSGMREKPKEEVDYIIVLGAKVDGKRITKSLLKRVEAAKIYLEEHKDVIAIVSGGQGDSESISEAKAMYDYLVSHGIDDSRIILEDKSTTTKENLVFSYEIIEEHVGGREKAEKQKLAIVTSNFHIFRAKLLAYNLGMKNISGLAAKADPVLLVNYMFRECAAMIKERMLGNI